MEVCSHCPFLLIVYGYVDSCVTSIRAFQIQNILVLLQRTWQIVSHRSIWLWSFYMDLYDLHYTRVTQVLHSTGFNCVHDLYLRPVFPLFFCLFYIETLKLSLKFKNEFFWLNMQNRGNENILKLVKHIYFPS